MSFFKSRRTMAAVFSVICIVTLVLLFILINTSKGTSKGTNEHNETANSRYTVEEYQGKIAVFKDGEAVPYEIFDTYVAVLPEHDRQLLKDGINVSSETELQKIIEDYTS